jgi:RND family efflux transporter MFP subunit
MTHRSLTHLGVLALLLAGLAPACRKAGADPVAGAVPRDKPASVPELRALVPEPVKHRPTYAATGTLQPAADVYLGFKTGGMLSRIRVQKGQRVKKGEVLLQLDTADVAVGIAQAEAAVRTAEVGAAMARDAHQRFLKLEGSGSIPEAQITQAGLQAQLAEAQVGQARAALRMAQQQLDNHLLRAPLDGTVLMAPDAPGMVVGPGTPLVEVADLTCLRLNASLPSEAMGEVLEGAPVRLEAGRVVVVGRVTRVLPALEPRGHRLPVEVELCGKEAEGLGNSYVRATFAAGEEQEAVRLPVTVLGREEEPGLFLVGEDGTARRRHVRVLAREQQWVVVTGLPAGGKVIDLPPEDLLDGAAVRLQAEPGRP